MRLYSIKRPRHEIQPEEILLDSFIKTTQTRSHKLEFPIQRSAVMIIVGMALFFLTVTGLLALYHQTVQHRALAQKSQENTLRNVMLQAPRGQIIDRYGRVMADNETQYTLIITSEDVPHIQAQRIAEADALAKLFSKDAKDLEPLFERGVKTNGTILMSNLTIDQALVFRAREQDFPGVRIVGTFKRIYPFGASASHAVGYTAVSHAQDTQQGTVSASRDVIGATGLEQTYNDTLQGKQGLITYEVNARQDILGRQNATFYEQGSTVQTTLDAELQQHIYAVLMNAIKDKKGGAIGIALDPSNGEVLALVSAPGFDPEAMSSGISQKAFQQLMNDPHKPFFNRAVQGEYSPGSTIKPFIALAALDAKTIDPNQKIDDTEGKITVPNPYDPAHPSVYRDWEAHGWVNMREAISQSCDVYFYTIGGGFGNIKGLGADTIKQYLEKFLWGKKTNIDIAGEDTGFVPDPAWKERTTKDFWRVGDTYNMSIGQGYIRTTPIQLAATSMAFANYGTVYQPHLVQHIINPETNASIQNFPPETLGTFPITKDNLQIVREGMRMTVTTGAASSRLQGLPFTLAGKTGSAQISSSLVNTNALFVSFMPYENPKILLLILVESGGGGSATAVPVSRDILEWYWYNRLQQ